MFNSFSVLLSYLNFELISICIASSEGSRAERFSLNPTSGELRAASPLRWAERAEYALTVTATDHGMPSLSSTCQLRIQVNIHLYVCYPSETFPRYLAITNESQSETVTSTHYHNPFAFLAASNFLKLCTK